MIEKYELTSYDKSTIKEVVEKQTTDKIAGLIQHRHQSDVWCRALIDEFLLYRNDDDIRCLFNNSKVRALLQTYLLGPYLLTPNTNSSLKLIEKQWFVLKILFPTPESLEPFQTHVDVLLTLLFFVANKKPPSLETLLLKLQIDHRLFTYQAPYGYRIGDQWLIHSCYGKSYDYSILDYLIGEGWDVFAYDPEKYNESSLSHITSPEILLYLLNSTQGKSLPLACINAFGDNIMHHVLGSKQLHIPELLGHKLMIPYLNTPNKEGLSPLSSLSKTDYTEQTMMILIANGLNLPVPHRTSHASVHNFFAKNQSLERRLLMQEIRDFKEELSFKL